MEKEELIHLYNKQARLYEKLRKKKKGFDRLWRKQLLSSAKGNILEVSVGAGANFKFYPAHVTVTAVDISSVMIEKAKQAALEAHVQADFIVNDIESLDFPARSFNTIVSTLSLCAYNEPIQVLNLFNKWCKDDGVILFMEHGLAKYPIMQWVQHKIDNFQYKKIGCHADRDIVQLIEDSALEIIKYERKMFGIMYLVWAKKGGVALI